MFFQVSWIRCHIVRIQGKKERRNPVKTGEKLLTLTIFELQLCSLHQKLRFEKPEWKLKCLWMPNQRGKVRDFRFGAISFEYREREEKDLRERYRQIRGQIWNLRDFEQIQVQFYQLFAKIIRWSLENLKKKENKFIVRLTRERKEGFERETYWQSKRISSNCTQNAFFCQFWSANSLI